jgi:hypothetical protein
MREHDHLALSDIAENLATRHRLGEYEEVLRRLRYFSAEGLLETVGPTHTGSGKKRLYPQSALIISAILLRLFETCATAGRMKEYMRALHKFVRREYQNKNLLEACLQLKRPTIIITVPDHSHAMSNSGQLLEWPAALDSIKPNTDVVVIQIYRFL